MPHRCDDDSPKAEYNKIFMLYCIRWKINEYPHAPCPEINQMFDFP